MGTISFADSHWVIIMLQCQDKVSQWHLITVRYLGCVGTVYLQKILSLKCNESITLILYYRIIKHVTTKRAENKTKQNKKAPQHLYRHYAQISNFPLQKK